MRFETRDGKVVTSRDTGTRGEVVRRTLEWMAGKGDEGLGFQCETFFPSSLNPAPGANEAKNVLSYNDVTRFPIVDVHCEF